MKKIIDFFIPDDNKIDIYSIGYALTGIFIILKLCHVINWSWLWVLSPLFIGYIIFIGILMIAGIIIFGVILVAPFCISREIVKKLK